MQNLSLKLLSILTIAFAIQGCGDSTSLTQDVTVSPASQDWTVASCEAPFTSRRQVTPLQILVRDINGLPMADSVIKVSASLAANTTFFIDENGEQVALDSIGAIEVYDDTNGDGVLDANEKVTESTDSVLYATKTNDSGVKTLYARYLLACEYRGTVFVYPEGAGLGQFDITVNLEEPTT